MEEQCDDETGISNTVQCELFQTGMAIRSKDKNFDFYQHERNSLFSYQRMLDRENFWLFIENAEQICLFDPNCTVMKDFLCKVKQRMIV